MSPEYLIHGKFSVKSDVYSFGVLVLEIVSGRENTSFRQLDPDFLAGHVSVQILSRIYSICINSLFQNL
ncbi:hypothetical protein DCAR_0935569 [Daucus carota subsp. sativus]|uniref:Protein kinase domain-containing protein n=1 Tax=Daucus carota subsp. sativus TaxID=79200 RepID=A0AAF0XXK2_DAUCS|nr:hypothetical protein DCAR_0935569 [Daucus carota subsp. sativus]